jgi:hypothetical protein
MLLSPTTTATTLPVEQKEKYLSITNPSNFYRIPLDAGLP